MSPDSPSTPVPTKEPLRTAGSVGIPLHWLMPVFAAGYWASALLSHSLAPPEAPFVSFWLPGGCYLAALLLCPTRRWPWLVLAAIAANATFDRLNGQPPLATCGFSLANTAEALTGAFLVRRVVGEQPRFNQLAETLRFVACSALLAPAVGATLGAANVVLVLGGDAYYRTWLMWWTGDATGVLLLAPLILLVAQARWTGPDAPSLSAGARTLAVTALAGLVSWLAMGAELHYGIGLKYLAIPFVGFMALQFGLRSALVTILAVGLVLAFRIALDDTAGPHEVHLGLTLALQFFLNVVGVTTLALGSLMEERRRRETDLSENRALLHAIVEGTSDAVYVKDPLGRYLLVNSAVCRVVGQPAAAILGRDDTALFPPAEAATIMAGDRAVLAGTAPRTYEESVTTAGGATHTYLSAKGPIRDARGELRGLFGIARDITERQHAEAERAALARTIERKNQELENLVYVTSHDLRSPLVNIQGFTQRLKIAGEFLQHAAATPEWSDELRREIAETGAVRIPKALGFIQSSVAKMERLIDGLLRLSRLGRVVLRPEPLDLNRMLDSIRDAMAHQLQSAGATVAVGPLPPVLGDAGLLNQVLTNLLDNAVKYRDPARPLALRLTGHRAGARAILLVADNGPGIPPEHLDKIWEIFHRVTPDGPVAGEGLGLTLVRRIVERHGGDIRVESAPGRGTCFTLALPAAPAADQSS